MDSSPDVLADEVRMKRNAVDNDLELLRIRLQKSRPTSQDAIRVAQRVLPVLAGTAGVWWWSAVASPSSHSTRFWYTRSTNCSRASGSSCQRSIEWLERCPILS